MPEIVKPKLNLKALEQTSGGEPGVNTPGEISALGDIKAVKEISPEIPLASIIPSIAKISLGGIKKSTQEVKAPQVTSGEKSTDTSIGDTAQMLGENISTPLSDSSGNQDQVTGLLVTGSGEDLQENSQEIQKEAVHSDPVQFQNYESGFKKQSSNVLKKIQNFRYTPKTRKGLVLGLITLCFGTIGCLMLLSPEKHSLGIYKASILYIIEKDTLGEENISPSDPITQSSDTTDIQPTGDDEIQDTIVIPETIGDESSIRQEKKEKLRQHLLKKYSSS